MNNEIWRDIKDYEGLYQVSNLGNVKSCGNKSNHKEEKIVAFDIARGYKRVSLNKNSVQTHKLVHRLVANAFIDNPENKPQVNHKDGNKLNNCVENLEWCTASENRKHGYSLGLIKNREKPVNQYTLDGTFIRSWKTIKEAATHYNMYGCHISGCCKGKNKTAGGYIWKYQKIS